MKLIVAPRNTIDAGNGPVAPGNEIEVSDADGQQLLAAGFALPWPGPGPKAPQERNAKDSIELVLSADLDGLNALAEGETRKTVLEAIAKRRQDLEGGA